MKDFTRDDLKQGMVMIDRIGLERVMVNNNTYCNDGEIYHIERYYNIDLTNINNHTNYDIMKVTFGNETIYERPEPKTTWFEPKENEEYYYSVEGYVGSTNRNHNIDEDLLKSQQVFQTREDAEKHLEWHQAHVRILKEIARLNNGWIPDWEGRIRNKHFVALDSNYKTFKSTSNSIFKILPNNMYLKSEELANQLIETHKDDLLIYFEVEK